MGKQDKPTATYLCSTDSSLYFTHLSVSRPPTSNLQPFLLLPPPPSLLHLRHLPCCLYLVDDSTLQLWCRACPAAHIHIRAPAELTDRCQAPAQPSSTTPRHPSWPPPTPSRRTRPSLSSSFSATSRSVLSCRSRTCPQVSSLPRYVPARPQSVDLTYAVHDSALPARRVTDC